MSDEENAQRPRFVTVRSYAACDRPSEEASGRLSGRLRNPLTIHCNTNAIRKEPDHGARQWNPDKTLSLPRKEWRALLVIGKQNRR
jgi:hypothetical protein